MIAAIMGNHGIECGVRFPFIKPDEKSKESPFLLFRRDRVGRRAVEEAIKLAEADDKQQQTPEVA